MKVRIFSTYGDAKELLEKLGILAIPDEKYDGSYQLEISSLEEIFELSDLLKEELIISNKDNYPYIEIYNDYRE